MNRIFQHYKGAVDQIIERTIKSVKYLIDDSSNDVILIWMETDINWLRIFIDGSYCGIDTYETDESESDEDDDISFKHISNNIIGKTIKTAQVSSTQLPHITLTIALSNDTKLILDCDKNEYCSLLTVP